MLREQFPRAYFIDLLHSDEFLDLSVQPHRLRERVAALSANDWVIIDEVQKSPRLLDEVHALIEQKKLRFGLCGSSARKLKRGHANLLGGRALRYELYGFSAAELGDDFQLLRALNHGYLPAHYLEDDYKPLLRAYVVDYLKEEILAEGLVRNLPQFSRFLEMSGQTDGEILNYSSIGRECAVSPKTAQNYYEILADTLVGTFVPAYFKRAKRRTVQAPRFYFHDLGVVNALAKRGELTPKTELFGKAFENWVFHELRCWQQYREPDQPISYWRLTTGVEVDFILGDVHTAIEVKGTDRIRSNHLKGLRELKVEFPRVKNRWIVCMEARSRTTDDGIAILPYREFLSELNSPGFAKSL